MIHYRENVRKLTCEDCIKAKETLANFYYQNLMSCSCISNFDIHAARKKIESLIEYVGNSSAFVYGYYVDDILCGYLWAYEHAFREEKRMYVSEIRVEEKYRGKGIGKKLLKAIEEEAKILGYPALYIHAEGNNKKAIKLYELLGYELERVQLRKSL